MALINLRNALMTGKRLPYDAEVEYLESTGTQWIDTGLPIAPNLYLDATFSVPSSIPHVLTFMGTSTQAPSFYRFWVCTIQTNKTINCGLINNALSTATLSADKPHNIYVKFFDGEQLCKLDGTTIVSAANTSDAAAKAAWLAQGNLLIGKANINETSNFIGKTFAVKIYDANGVLVRDFIPVRKGAVGYLYDRVSRKLFGNQGTGDFVVGPDVVPVEWLCSSANNINIQESNPAVWIDTGIALSADIKMSLVASFASFTSGTARLMGTYGGLSGRFDIGVSANGTFLTSIGATTPNITSDTYVHKFVLDAPNHMGYVDENGVSTGSDFSVTIPGNIMLFTRGRGDLQPPVDYYSWASKTVATIYSAEIWKANTLVRSFRPVRVGTDATSWEGAMMDVLTRRIYRNAGTGAFTYGNDLKYPIPAE